MPVTNALGAGSRETETESTATAFKTISIAFTLRHRGLALTVAAPEERNSTLATLSIIIADKGRHTAAGNAVAFGGTVVTIGAGAIGTHTGLALANLGCIGTIRISQTEVLADFTPTIQTSFRVCTLIIPDTVRLNTKGISAHRHARTISIFAAVRLDVRDFDGHSIARPFSTPVICEDVVHTRVCSFNEDF